MERVKPPTFCFTTPLWTDALVSTHVAHWALSVLAAVGLGGVAIVNQDFDPDNPWFFVGLTVIILTAIASNAVMREARTRTMNDEFDTGYRVGYRAGRRASLTVARSSPGPSKPVPLRPKRSQMNEPTWPDSDDSPPGSTRRP